MKRVLVVHFSQTGQLRQVAASLCAPLAGQPDIRLDDCALQPETPYPFPWPFWRFFDEFPEAVHLDPPPLRPLDVAPDARYDLVILAYTVWFLSPAPPVTAFLQSAAGRALLRDTPVITVIACRNMWHLAQEEVKKLLSAAGARLSDNVVLTDPGSSLATFITTPRWMLTGRREAFGPFPRAGLTATQIADTRRFGDAILQALREDRVTGHAPVLTGLAAVESDTRLVASERIGRRSFFIWGRLIRAIGPRGSWRRRPVLALYVAFLVTMIVTVVPLSLLLRALLRPLAARRMAAQKRYFEAPSGSGRERMAGAAHG